MWTRVFAAEAAASSFCYSWDEKHEAADKLLYSYHSEHIFPAADTGLHSLFIQRSQLDRCSAQISVHCRLEASFFFTPGFFSCGQILIFQTLERVCNAASARHHPPRVSPLCHISNNTPGTTSLAVTGPNPSFHRTDFWIKEGRFPHLWIVSCYGAHASFHASFLLRRARKWEHFFTYTDLERFWMSHLKPIHEVWSMGEGGEWEWLLW